MTTHLVMVPEGTSVSAVRDRLRDETEHRADVDRVLVIDRDGSLVDDLALFDLFLADATATVDDLVEPPWPVTVRGDASLEEVVARLVDSRVASVVVVDESDRPIGRILADDVVDALVPEKAKLRFPRILG